MRTETPKTLLVLVLTVLLCIAFDCESSAYAMAPVKSENACYSKLFQNVSCSGNNEIRVINALYGYSNCYSTIGECCPSFISDCFVSVPSYGFNYYQTIMELCNNKQQCSPQTVWTDVDVKCYGNHRSQSDYVRLEYNCLPLSKNMTTTTLCRSSSNFQNATTLRCYGNERIEFVGAILGFQNNTEESCRPGENRCRTQPDAAHLLCIQSACQGQQKCTVYAADSAPADNTCSQFKYMYENITYYCDNENQVSKVSPAEPSCWQSSSTPTSSPTTSLASTWPRNTSMEVSLPTINANTTDHSDSQDDDNLDVIIGVSVGCILVIMLIIVPVTIIVIRKRKASLENQHAYVKPDKERHRPYTDLQHNERIYYNDPQTMLQTGGQNVNQDPTNYEEIGVGRVSYEITSLSSGNVYTETVDASGTNTERDYDEAAVVRMTGVKALRPAVVDEYENAAVVKIKTEVGDSAAAAMYSQVNKPRKLVPERDVTGASGAMSLDEDVVLVENSLYR